jgi:chromosome segregation ATPase
MENNTPPRIETKDEEQSEGPESHYEQHREMARPTSTPNPAERLTVAKADGDGGGPLPKEVKVKEFNDLNKRERELDGQVKVLETRVEDRKKELDRCADDAPEKKKLTDAWLSDQRDLKTARHDLNETRKEMFRADTKFDASPDAANRLDVSKQDVGGDSLKKPPEDLAKRERELDGQVKVLEARVEDRKKELDRLPDEAPNRKELTDLWQRDQRDLKIAKNDLNETQREIIEKIRPS